MTFTVMSVFCRGRSMQVLLHRLKYGSGKWVMLSQPWPALAMQTNLFTTAISAKCQKSPPKLTSERFPQIKRGNFAKLTEKDVAFFQSLLGSRVLREDLEGYNTDWMNIFRGASQLVMKPKNTSEVSEILKYCNQRKLAVVPQGGKTGLVGGSVPVFDEIILSMQLMDKIISVDEIAGVIICQSGCILENLDEHLSGYNLMMPLDLGSKGSCQIGGNVSTSAGGIRLLRYGSLHGSVLGLEAVKADGQIVDCLSSMRKDNTGYDLKQLFIGSEGTLGVITTVSILCPQKPRNISLAFLACSTFNDVLSTLREARSQLQEILSAFEFFDNECMMCNQSNMKLSNPLNEHNFYIVLETSGSNQSHDEEKLNMFVETIMGSEIANDGIVVTEPSKIQKLWSLREKIPESLLRDGYCFKYDVSLPMDHYYQLVEDIRVRLDGRARRVVGYGHVGDGNLHLNVTAPKYSSEIHALVEPYIYEYVASLRGSISAEHGLGFVKNTYIHYSKTPEAVLLMKQLKKMMDPNGILNPYKTLPMPL